LPRWKAELKISTRFGKRPSRTPESGRRASRSSTRRSRTFKVTRWAIFIHFNIDFTYFNILTLIVQNADLKTFFQIKSVQNKLDNVSNQLDKVKKEITRLEVGIKSSERDLKKSKDKYEAFDAEVAELENKIREGKTERDDLVKQNETLEAQVAELKVNFLGKLVQRKTLNESLINVSSLLT